MAFILPSFTSVAVLLALTPAAPRVELVNEVLRVPPDDWRYVEISVRQLPARLVCSYEVLSPYKDVRLALMHQIDLERLRNREPHGYSAITPLHATGTLEFRISKPGLYSVVVQNQGPEFARVRLRVIEDFSASREPDVRYLSRTRQITVIVTSFFVFFGIVTWSARRLLRGIRNGPGATPPDTP